MRCGVVYPVWVQVGWIHWSGTPQREKQYMLERKCCTSEATETKEWKGLTFSICPEHAKEMFLTGPKPPPPPSPPLPITGCF